MDEFYSSNVRRIAVRGSSDPWTKHQKKTQIHSRRSSGALVWPLSDATARSWLHTETGYSALMVTLLCSVSILSVYPVYPVYPAYPVLCAQYFTLSFQNPVE